MFKSKLAGFLKNRDQKTPYFIGETACHHQGEIDYLYKIIEGIAELKVNAVKLHMLLNPESYIEKRCSLFQKYKEWVFSREQWSKIIDFANKKKLDIIFQCNDVDSIKYLNQSKKKISAVLISATELNEWFLLKEAAKFKGPVFLGIGGSTTDEISGAIDFLRKQGKKEIVLMYGFQNYPTNYAELNLARMLKIKKLFGLPMGYADHTDYNDKNNEIISVLPVMTGFNILEKHYTPDLGKKRIDFESAVGKEQIKRVMELACLIVKVKGSGSFKFSKGELEYGELGPMKKAIVARKLIKKGEKLSWNNLWFKRTETKSFIRQGQFWDILGKEVNRNIREGEKIDFNMLKK